jgi:hypothetical protein
MNITTLSKKRLNEFFDDALEHGKDLLQKLNNTPQGIERNKLRQSLRACTTAKQLFEQELKRREPKTP